MKLTITFPPECCLKEMLYLTIMLSSFYCLDNWRWGHLSCLVQTDIVMMCLELVYCLCTICIVYVMSFIYGEHV
jgi:hypothetical protein